MKKRKIYKPYIRRMKKTDYATDFQTVIRLAFYESRKNAFVMVQRGFPGKVFLVGQSKRDVMNMIVTISLREKTFKQWAGEIQKNAFLM